MNILNFTLLPKAELLIYLGTGDRTMRFEEVSDD